MGGYPGSSRGSHLESMASQQSHLESMASRGIMEADPGFRNQHQGILQRSCLAVYLYFNGLQK